MAQPPRWQWRGIGRPHGLRVNFGAIQNIHSWILVCPLMMMIIIPFFVDHWANIADLALFLFVLLFRHNGELKIHNKTGFSRSFLEQINTWLFELAGSEGRTSWYLGTSASYGLRRHFICLIHDCHSTEYIRGRRKLRQEGSSSVHHQGIAQTMGILPQTAALVAIRIIKETGSGNLGITSTFLGSRGIMIMQ